MTAMPGLYLLRITRGYSAPHLWQNLEVRSRFAPQSEQNLTLLGFLGLGETTGRCSRGP